MLFKQENIWKKLRGDDMLKIFDADIDDISKLNNVIHDVNEAFSNVKLENDEITEILLNEIELGKYYNEERFVDRFGVPVYTSELSTGCKAALCVHYMPDKVIDLIECGTNARDAILKYCKDGNVIYYGMDTTVSDFGCENLEVDIDLHGNNIKRIGDFNDYYEGFEYYN